MKVEDKNMLIKGLEDIKNKDSAIIDDLEILLSELKKDHKELINLLISLKSKVKNDEEAK